MSLTGVVPLGVFVLAHLAAMTEALRGSASFAGALSHQTRFRLGAEALLIGVPLLFHAGVGLALARQSRANVGTYPYSGNLAWVLQRVSGVVVLLFVLAHVWETRVRVLLGLGSSADLQTELYASLSSTGFLGIPFVAVGYLVGVAATVYHLANGIVGFAASFGLVASTRSLERVARISALVGALVFLVSAATVIQIATGSISPWGAQ